jgi:hypothetical protein
MRHRRAKRHVTGANQLDPALIGSASGRRSKSTRERDTNEFWIIRIGLHFQNVPIQNNDLSLLKLAGRIRLIERQPMRLFLCVHGAENSPERLRFANPS